MPFEQPPLKVLFEIVMPWSALGPWSSACTLIRPSPPSAGPRLSMLAWSTMIAIAAQRGKMPKPRKRRWSKVMWSEQFGSVFVLSSVELPTVSDRCRR